MNNIFDDIEFSKKVFLKEIYSSILKELIQKKTHGQIVRRLKSEGYKTEEADSLYLLIINSPEQAQVLVDKLNKDITEQQAKQKKEQDEKEKQYEREQKRLEVLRKQQEEEHLSKYLQKIEEKKKEDTEAIKIGAQLAADLLQKFFGL